MPSESDREWGSPFVAEALRGPPGGPLAGTAFEGQGPFALEEEVPAEIRLNVQVVADRRSSATFWQPQNDLELSCGQALRSITGSATARFAGGKTQDVTASIRWMWAGEDRGAGATPSGIDGLAAMFEESTHPIGILARVDMGSVTSKVVVTLRTTCSLRDLGALTADEKLLARLVYAEAFDLGDGERAAIAWTIRNRVRAIAGGDAEAKGSFGAEPTLQAVIQHKTPQGQKQYDAYWRSIGGKGDAAAVWNAIDAPGALPCRRCAMLRSAIKVARGVLRGEIADPYAAEGGAFFFHKAVGGVIEEDRKGAIVRLPRKDFVHHFWSYAPTAARELELEEELYGGPAPSPLADAWRAEPAFEQLTTDPIAGPVGRRQANARDDVLRVQARLRELGMAWVPQSGAIRDADDDPTDRAIRLFRGILDAADALDASAAGGVIAPASRQEQWLRSPSAPRWLAQVPAQRNGWCVNNSRAAPCSPDDGSHGLASWLAGYLDQVGGAFRGKAAAVRRVLDAYVSGHRAALDRLASPHLPRVGPHSAEEEDALRTRDVARRVIADLIEPATTHGQDAEALARSTRDAIATGAVLLSVGHIARPEGGHYPPHAHHQTGLQFDLRLFGHGGPQEALVWSDPRCSRLLAGLAIDCLLEHPHTVTVIHNDPELRRRAAGRVTHDGPNPPRVHDNHIHVAIRGADAHTLLPPPTQVPPTSRRGPEPEVAGADEAEVEAEADFERLDPAPSRGTVYLTFDDGLQLGSQQVFDVLRRADVRGTFFLTGAHVRYYEKNVAAGLLAAMAADARFDIANHSQSHANQRTAAFYAGGIVLRNGARRSVLDDFRLCDATVAAVLGRPPAPLALGRLPGRNTWRVRNLPGVTDKVHESDSAEEADALSRAGYQIFGWDAEWFMDFHGTKDISDFDPDVDPTDESRKPDTYWTNPAFDRPIQRDGKAFAAEVLCKLASAGLQKKGKLVLLMHDRAFRPTTGPDPALYTRELEVLIQEFKAAGVSFDKMSSY
jgi:peptidoglycan/xylan/chitin deacetylase (PgdA/CDA1 family)